jgi:hypothetical protein
VSIEDFRATRLVHGGSHWTIDGLPAAHLPMAVNQREGTPFLLQAFLLQEGVRDNAAWRTVEKKGYVLCAWWDYLHLNGIRAAAADEDDLIRFLLGNGKRSHNLRSLPREEVQLSPSNWFRFETVCAFHNFIEGNFKVQGAVKAGHTLGTLKERMTSGGSARRFSRQGSGSGGRPTPADDEAQRVVDSMLEMSNSYRGQTFYLIGRLAKDGGFRAGGVESLTIKAMFAALAGEAQIRKIADYKVILANFREPANSSVIQKTLQKLIAEGRKFVFCKIRMKGSAIKPAPIPINLFIEIMDYICSDRDAFIRSLPKQYKRKIPDNVFLSGDFSLGTGVYTTESISNVYNAAFKSLDIPGSFHRLRAAFAVEIVRDLYLRERALNGRAWQAANVLEIARQLLGHKNTKTLKSYLNDVIAEELAAAGEPILIKDPKDAALIRGLVYAMEDDDQIRRMFYDWAKGVAISPVDEPNKRGYPEITQ